VRDKIEGWRGQEIVGARSRRGRVFAARDWRDLVLDPVGDIRRKAVVPAPLMLSHFDPDERPWLTEVTGSYSAVQSINCEDGVTSAAFGARANDRIMRQLLSRAFEVEVPAGQWMR
jgi:hypothetical protein